MHPEKRYFLRSLISLNNWPGNMRSFFNYAERALRFRISNKLRPAHTVMKITPPWFPAEKVFPAFCEAALRGPGSVKTLELPPGWQDGVSELSRSSIPADDPERYLNFHRWGWIVRGYLNAALTLDESFGLIEKWIQQNTNRNEYEWEPYSCCERIANIFVLFLQLPIESRKRILSCGIGSFILDSAYWVKHHAEYYGPGYTNNHILNNGRSLAIAGVLMDDKNILEAALAIFKNMLPELVTKSGFLRERSSHYQLIVLRWILDAEKAMSLSDDPVVLKNIDSIRHYADRMAHAAVSLCDSRGMLKVLIGDVSPDAEPNETCELLNNLYPQWKRAGAIERPGEAREGWFFLRQGRLEIVTQQMEEYPLKYPSHGHADVSSFIFLFDGRQVLVDPGRNSYTKGPLAKRFTEGLFHNVPLVNGLAPAVSAFFSNWTPERYGSVKINSGLSDMYSLRIEHNGFSRLGEQIRHTRIISINGVKLKVSDEFTGKKVYEVTLCWHFSPGFKVELKDEGCTCLSSSFCSIAMTTAVLNKDKSGTDACSFCKVYDKSGWYSPCYGVAQEARTIHVSGRFKFPVVISTTFEVKPCAE